MPHCCMSKSCHRRLFYTQVKVFIFVLTENGASLLFMPRSIDFETKTPFSRFLHAMKNHIEILHENLERKAPVANVP